MATTVVVTLVIAWYSVSREFTNFHWWYSCGMVVVCSCDLWACSRKACGMYVCTPAEIYSFYTMVCKYFPPPTHFLLVLVPHTCMGGLSGDWEVAYIKQYELLKNLVGWIRLVYYCIFKFVHAHACVCAIMWQILIDYAAFTSMIKVTIIHQA